MLEKLGFRADVAGNGKEALEALKRATVRQSSSWTVKCRRWIGFEATAAIRDDENLATIPVIAMTANAMKGDRDRCLRAGMDDYIAKPVRSERLKEVLDQWLEKVGVIASA